MATFSFVCLSCNRLREAREKDPGAERCLAALEGKECGGPLVGMSFPHYAGPLEGALHKVCFVCGKPPKYLMRPSRGGRNGGVVAVCSGCIDILRSYSAPGKRPLFVDGGKIRVLCPGGDEELDLDG